MRRLDDDAGSGFAPQGRAVVFCAGTPYDGVAGSDWHLVQELQHLVPVLWVDPPQAVQRSRPATLGRLGRLTPLTSTLARFTPLAPPLSRRFGVTPLTQRSVRWQIDRAVAALQIEPIAHLSASDLVLFERDHRRGRRVLYATDDFAAGAELMGLRRSEVERNERRLAQLTDLVIAISEPIAARWRAAGIDATVIPNGVHAHHYRDIELVDSPPDVRLPRPVVGLVGQLNERIDADIVKAIAERGNTVLCIGPVKSGSAIDRLRGHPNVHFVGRRPFAELPSYLRTVDVGITPYCDTPFNRASFPLKTLEYVAAGRPAVCTDLPAAAALDARFVTRAASTEQFVAAVEHWLAAPRTADAIAARQCYAATHSWSMRARSVAAALGVVPQPSMPGGLEAAV